MSQYPSVRKPTFATSATGLANTVDPGVTKQSNGWAANERPPAEFFNWLENAHGQWIDFLHNASTETRNAFGASSGNYVLRDLSTSLAGLVVSVTPGACVLLESTAPAGEPVFNPCISSSTLSLTLPVSAGAGGDAWYAIFGQRNATTTSFEIVAVPESTANNLPSPGAEQVYLALVRNGAVYDARQFRRDDLNELGTFEARYKRVHVHPVAGDSISIKADVDYRMPTVGGRSLTYRGNVTTLDAQLLGGISSLTANTVYYLHLFAAGVAAPYDPATGNNCIPILQTTTPSAGFAHVKTFTPTIGAIRNGGRATLIAVLRRNSTNNGWDSWVTDDGFVTMNEVTTATTTVTNATTGTSTVTLNGAGIIALQYKCKLSAYVYGTMFSGQFSAATVDQFGIVGRTVVKQLGTATDAPTPQTIDLQDVMLTSLGDSVTVSYSMVGANVDWNLDLVGLRLY